MSNQVTGPGSLYDADGTLIAAGMNVPAGAASGCVLTSDSAGNATWKPSMILLATTGGSGFALQNATPNILTWTPPNDGAMHRVVVVGQLIVGSNETGGRVVLNFNNPDGSVVSRQIWAAALTAGFQTASTALFCVQAGVAVSLVQNTALTGGAATVYAELWGS